MDLENLSLRKAQWITGGFLFAHFIFVFWQPGYLWGIDFLSYYTPLQSGIFLVLSLATIFSFKYAQAILTFIFSLTSGLRFYVFLLICILLFIGLQTQTHLLGDGDLFLRELATLDENQEWIRPNRSPLIYALIQFLNRIPNISSLLAYQIYSWTSGILYVCAAILFSKDTNLSKNESALLFASILSTGLMVQFFGYVENYALLFPAILLFLFLGIRTLNQECHIFIFSAFTGLLLPIHFIAISLIPAFFVALHFALINTQVRKPSSYILKFTFCLILSAAVTLIIFTGVHFDFIAYFQKSKSSHFLPILDIEHTYHFFSLFHILDITNLLLLTCPFGCIIFLVLMPNCKLSFSPKYIFLISASFFPFLMVAFANPEIGFFRDWDIFSLVAIPITILTFNLLRDHCPSPKSLSQIGTPIVATALLHTILWIGINITPQKSVQRFEAILRTETVPPVPAAFSWETLGIYYRKNNQPEAAQTAYEKALKNDPNNARYLNALGIFHHIKDDTENALSYFKRALTQKPDLAPALANIGDILFQKSQYDSSIFYYEQALKNGLQDLKLFHQLSAANQALGNAKQAKYWLSKVPHTP